MGAGMLTARSLMLPACCGTSLGDLGMCFISVLQRSGLDGGLSTTLDGGESWPWIQDRNSQPYFCEGDESDRGIFWFSKILRLCSV